jgi:hypothetical protein
MGRLPAALTRIGDSPLVYRPVICAYVVLLRYGLRISRKHWIKSLSDLSRVHELWHFEMEGLGSQ